MAHGETGGDGSRAEPGPVPGGLPPVQYLVVVHGMGEQRRNETVTDAIRELGRAAAPAGRRDLVDTILPGGLSQGATSVCYAGIPAHGVPAVAFDGQTRGGPDDLHFAEVAWADITAQAVRETGVPPQRWVEAVVNRIVVHDERLRQRPPRPGVTDPAEVPRWLTHLMYTLRPIIRLARPIVRRLAPRLDQTAFFDYLGDVQAYTESPATRDAAVRRTHATLARLQREHEQRYPGRDLAMTLLAHSLGSVLALDALLVAHLAPAGRARYLGVQPPTAPPPGVGPAAGSPPRWLEKVVTLVTLGSPLDKVAALWPATQRGRGAPDHPLSRRVRHVNFVETMDLVADPLRLVPTSPLYRAVFGDRAPLEYVYTHDQLPFRAHVHYWRDAALFTALRAAAWPAAAAAEPPALDAERGAAQRARELSLLLLPWLLGCLFVASMVGSMRAGSWWLSAVLAGAAGLLGVTSSALLRLLTWWHALVAQRAPAAPAIDDHVRIPGVATVGWGVVVFTAGLVGYGTARILRPAHDWLFLVTLLVVPAVIVSWQTAWTLLTTRRPGPTGSGLSLAVGMALTGLLTAAMVGYLQRRMPGAFSTAFGPEHVVAVSAAVGLSLGFASRAFSVPARARLLAREHRASVFWRSWGLAVVLWLVGFLVASLVDLASSGGSGGGGRSAPAVDWLRRALVACFGDVALPLLVFFAVESVLALFLTVVRTEYVLASRALRWKAWASLRWEDYVLEEDPPAAGATET